MKYLLFFLLLAFGSCNVAKKVFRHKDKSIIQVKRDSTGKSETHIDTSKKSSLRTISSTDIIRQGKDAEGSGETDLDQLKISARKGKAMVIPLLNDLGNVVGSLSTVFDSVNNRLKQTAHMNVPPEEIHQKSESEGSEEQKGLTDHHQESALKVDNKDQHSNQDMTKDVKRSPAWIKITLIISGVIIVLLALFKRKNIWAWLKNKILNK